MNAGKQSAAAYASLYCPSSRELIQPMPEIGNRLQGQLHELAMRPTPDRAELLALQLEGARRSVLKLREALIREAGGHAADVNK